MKLKFLAATFFSLVFAFWPVALVHASAPGLKVEVYTFDPTALPDRQPYQLCQTAITSVSNINFDVGADVVAECQADYVIIHYSGYLTLDRTGLVSLQSWADDGFYLTLDDQVVINDWTLKGCSGSSALIGVTAGVSMKLDAWFYEYGGGACNILRADGIDIPDSAFTQSIVAPPEPEIPTLEAPYNLQAELVDEGVKLTWGYYLRDTPVERFAVLWSYEGSPSWAIASLTPETVITDLLPDTEYTFWVRSDNDSLQVYSPNSEQVTNRTPKPVIVDPVDPVEPPVDPVDPPIDPVTPVEPVPTPEPTLDPEPTPEPVVEPVEPVLPEPEIIDVLTPQEQHSALMNALMEEAQADDIQIPEEIANIPVLGATIVALTDALNFMGNVGADMTPEVRAKAEKELVAAVVLTQITQFSTNQAVASAQASAGANGSSTRRRN
jgi:hypothetical protein